MNSELLDFVRRALEKGVAPAEVTRVLAQAGWAEAEIVAATGAFASVDFPVPVPKPRPYLSARDSFIYLLLFTSLYFSAYHLGALVFELIDRAYPDPLANANLAAFIPDRIRWDISALLVAVPLFLFVFAHVEKAIARDSSKRDSRPRKWLTYLTLFIAAASLIGDLATLVYNVLGGEYAVRFLLKIATVALIAGTIFIYFLSEIRRDETVKA